VNQTAQTLALVGATLGAVVITFLGTAFLQHLQARRDARQQLATGVAELLAAAQDVLIGVRTIREAHGQRTKLRFYLRLVATVSHAVPQPSTWRDLIDYPTLRPALGSLMSLERESAEAQRLVVIDTATILAPRLNRYFAVAALLTLGADQQVADAVRQLTPRVTALPEAFTGPRFETARARNRRWERLADELQKAMEDFRAVADKRLGNSR
jgi:hypothetical protein